MNVLEKIKWENCIVDDDSVLLFYQEDKIEEVLKIFVDNYNDECEDSDRLNINIGYETPILVEYKFMGNKYKAISLWFDNEDIDDFFLK